jgi:putative ABC transport system permease protein
MLKNYLKIAIRSLRKNKVFSLINILGLTIGITVCMMIFLFVMNEFSYDDFHKDGDRIYRVERGMEDNGQSRNVAYLSGMYEPALLNDFNGEIESAVRVMQNDNLITIGNKSFHEKKEIDVDSNFFNFFTFPLIIGNPQTVLEDPHSVVLTESTAKKYFGSIDNAIGKVIVLGKIWPLKVTGIAKDIPSNSHLDFDIVVPLYNYRKISAMTTWITNDVYTYIKAAPGITKTQIQKQLPAFMEKYLGGELKKYGFHWTLSITPLRDIYFENSGDNVKHGDKTVVYIFLSVAVLILIIACINFMNLSTMRAIDRSKEVGVRKVLGALRNILVWQFIGESLFFTTISCILSVGLLEFITPWYNQLLGYSITASWNTLPIYVFLIGVIIIVGFFAGSYPAFFLSAFSPIQALKGKLKLGKSGAAFRQTLVVLQFSISVFLIIGTIIITMQMSYVKNKKLGYNQEQIVVVPINNDDIYNNMNTFKTNLQNESVVQSVSLMSGEPGGFFDEYTFNVEDQNRQLQARTEFADFDFVKTLGLKIIAGRDFSAEFPTDTNGAVLINKTAATKLGWTPQQAIGKWIFSTLRDTSKRRIIGVVNDFNFQSLKQDIDALVISPYMDRRQALIKLKPGNIQADLELIKQAYNKAAPGYPFEYSFLDEKFDALYKNDLRQQTVLTVFASLAIFIACLGLLGLAAYTAEQRTKEIGIRKVLGATVPEIMFMLTKEFTKWVLFANIIAWPLAYFFMKDWLQNFAYRINISIWIFLLSGICALLIAVITVGYQAIKAASANPVKSLRYE